MRPISRRRYLVAGGLALLAGCRGSGGSREEETRTSPPPDDADSETAIDRFAEPPEIPTADERLPLPASPQTLRDNARSGGPPKDGILSIDEPKFVGAGAVDFLDPGDPVFGVVRDGVAKAYPQKVLVQHEIVNDELAGTPVSVTYCPLTGTVQGFERGETTFGVSGRLINANLVMYDRATEAWWPQILATSIPGAWNEGPAIRTLSEFRLIWTTWRQWREQNPDTRVLSTDTGHANNYGRDPYGSYNPRTGYYETDNLMFPTLNEDDRYPKKKVVMGARTPDGAAAFVKEALRNEKLTTGEIGDTPVLAAFDPRYDTGYVYLNPDEREYEYDDGSIVRPDGTSATPDEVGLDRVHTFDAMWFAWAGYYPDTNVYD